MNGVLFTVKFQCSRENYLVVKNMPFAPTIYLYHAIVTTLFLKQLIIMYGVYGK